MRGKTNLLRWPVCVLFLLVALRTVATGEVIYVDDDAAGANNGSSWSEAFTDLQDALAAALEGDEIHVAGGIYTPTQDPLDREATFDLKDGVSITGGYAGLAGMYPDFRHTKYFTTILSGDIDNNDDSVDPNNKEGNSRHVVTCMGEGNSAILEGVTVTAGFSNGTGIHGDAGAGGGLYCSHGCSPQLIDCVFTNNYAGNGGAVYLASSYGFTDEDVSDERIRKPVFIRCIFADNNANSSGAVSNGRGWHSEFINCVFENNYAEYSGGAISSGQRSTLKFNHCVFRRNSADRRGGAISTNIRSEIRVVNCLFVANTADDSGGAISGSDLINGNGDSLFDLVNCTFYGNTSPTFYRPPTNSTKQPDGSRERWSGSVVTNCIFYNSIAHEVSEIPFSEVPVSFNFGPSEPLIIMSIYEKGPELGGDGTVPPTLDPLFVDPYGVDGILGTEDDDFHLASDSPAIDSGTNETEPPLPAMDLDGYPRILNDIVDLGTYEFTGVFYVDDDVRHNFHNNISGRTGK
jgi:predicted outer membrane repeat protein